MGIDWIERSQRLELGVHNFVNGRRRASGGDPVEKYSPRDGKLLCRFGGGEMHDVEEAVAIAKAAFDDGRWSRVPAQRRKDVLHRLASLIEAHAEELALLECLDVGKPISDALALDVPVAAATIRFNAEALDKVHGKVYGADQTSLSYQLRRPIGVVAGIVGWNFPLWLAASKIGPALATGNSLVLKPSEMTSFSTSRVAELAVEAGVPEGVLNVIHGGPHLGAALAHHPDVQLLTFTGSTHTGKKLLVASGQSNMKRLILECGGKAPHIVFDDCPDLDAAAQAVALRAFYNQGEVCSSSSRLLIQQNIKEEFMQRLISKAARLTPGDPLDASTQFGALVSKGHHDKVASYIAAGESEGARVVYHSDAAPPFKEGYYISPLIFDQVNSRHRIAQEEIFGPVLSTLSFKDEDEAVRIANDTIYGLSAVLWTKDVGRAQRVVQGVNAGWIVANTTGVPMGGVGIGVMSVGGHKESGWGAEGGIEGLEEYTSKTAVQLFV